MLMPFPRLQPRPTGQVPMRHLRGQKMAATATRAWTTAAAGASHLARAKPNDLDTAHSPGAAFSAGGRIGWLPRLRRR
ncbi:hypothetical protein GV68_03905 [Pseudorhizobium pelagicum]|uniref:Uncharacterized protein n=1 Tax=Pseudorhizobium pelagicum TaxID=1509405 RepID=A0A922T9B7_9HYPH|nr:hypothetical protein GV68_03905 [Pseudorhizobium pelagicum]